MFELSMSVQENAGRGAAGSLGRAGGAEYLRHKPKLLAAVVVRG